MKRRQNEKLALEKTAIQLFIQIYNQNHLDKLRLLYQQEQPDAVLQINEQDKLGLEITHLFYDELEAKILLGRSDQDPYVQETLDHLIEELNMLIRRKENKMDNYSKNYPIALLIRNASLLFGMSDILSCRNRIYKPQNLFTQIWLLSRDGYSDWLLKDLKTVDESSL